MILPVSRHGMSTPSTSMKVIPVNSELGRALTATRQKAMLNRLFAPFRRSPAQTAVWEDFTLKLRPFGEIQENSAILLWLIGKTVKHVEIFPAFRRGISNPPTYMKE